MIKVKLQGPFNSVLYRKQTATLALLAAFVLVQALGVIYTKQTRRLLHAKIQSLYAQRDLLQVEWSKLLLEQGTWLSESRVEKIAGEHLNMVVPTKTEMITP